MRENLHNIVYKNLATLLCQSVKTSYSIDVELNDVYNMLGLAPNSDLGHFAFGCFKLAKPTKNNPAQVASTIVENLPNNEVIRQAKAAGPYINIFLNTQWLGANVIDKIIDNEFFTLKKLTDAPKTMIEYSQPNTHKVLHVGHMRNLCLGSAMVNLFRYTDHETIAVTYPGDVGTHVAKCLWYLKKHNTQPVPSENKGAWLGEMYSTANNLLEDQLGTENEDTNRAELTKILKELESESGEYFDLWKETKEWSIDLMKEAYSWANVEFDRWFFESEMDRPSLEFAKKLHKEGKLIEDQGAIGMDLSENKLGFCMLIKTDGNGLYATKDVLLAQKKFEEFGVEHNIYVVDVRQAYHFKQVFKVLENLGYENADKCYHLAYDFVELPDGAMSSRKGNIVPLMELVQNMEQLIKNDYLSRYNNEWPVEKINETARIVAGGAIKYGMIRMDNNRKIVFDMKEWLKLDGETGPYLQYTGARINSLVTKLGFSSQKKANMKLLTHKTEEKILTKLSIFNTVCVGAAVGHKTPLLCSYLYELAKLFNSFYAECSVGNAENEELKNARLWLSAATGKVIGKGLSLLGIETPKEM